MINQSPAAISSEIPYVTPKITPKNWDTQIYQKIF